MKFYDPHNSTKDPEVKISIEEDEPLNDNQIEQEETTTKEKTTKTPVINQNMRMTRSRIKALAKENNMI